MGLFCISHHHTYTKLKIKQSFKIYSLRFHIVIQCLFNDIHPLNNIPCHLHVLAEKLASRVFTSCPGLSTYIHRESIGSMQLWTSPHKPPRPWGRTSHRLSAHFTGVENKVGSEQLEPWRWSASKRLRCKQARLPGSPTHILTSLESFSDPGKRVEPT